MNTAKLNENRNRSNVIGFMSYVGTRASVSQVIALLKIEKPNAEWSVAAIARAIRLIESKNV